MRRALSVGWALLGLAVGGARAQLSCAQPEQDVGAVKSGQVVVRRFLIVNKGRQTADILGVRTECGCLAPRMDRTRLAPGESATLEVEINTLAQAPGPQHWHAMLAFETRGQAGQLPLEVHGEIVEEVRVEPAALSLVVSGPVAHTVTVRDVRPNPLIVKAAHVTARGMQVTVNPDRRSARVEVLPDCPDGKQEAVLHLVTDDPQYRDLRVPLTLLKRPRLHVRAAPAEVTFASVGLDAQPERLVRLAAVDGRRVVVEAVQADDPAVSCRWEPGPGDAATLLLSLDRSKLSGAELHATVRVRLTGPAAETLTIPVTAALR
jgi:hypothetical protein